MDVKGRNLTDGLPKSVEITSAEIRDVLAEPVSKSLQLSKKLLRLHFRSLQQILLTGAFTLQAVQANSEVCRNSYQKKLKCRCIFLKSRLIV